MSPRLQQLRRQIDRLDLQLLRLLNRRAVLAMQVGALKRKGGRQVFDPKREQSVLRRVARANRGPLPRASLQQLFKAILQHSRHLEESR